MIVCGFVDVVVGVVVKVVDVVIVCDVAEVDADVIVDTDSGVNVWVTLTVQRGGSESVFEALVWVVIDVCVVSEENDVLTNDEAVEYVV